MALAPVRSAPAPAYEDPYRSTTLHPRTYNEARTIGEHFRDGTPVIMNLTEMDDTDAKRLVDFAAGLSFGLHGRIVVHQGLLIRVESRGDLGDHLRQIDAGRVDAHAGCTCNQWRAMSIRRAIHTWWWRCT